MLKYNCAFADKGLANHGTCAVQKGQYKTMDCMDSRLKNGLSYLGWHFDLPGVKGHMPMHMWLYSLRRCAGHDSVHAPRLFAGCCPAY